MDFYLGAPGEDLEHAALLEVAGIDEGSLSGLLQAKLEQARANSHRLPAIAAVVRFDAPQIMMDDARHG